MKIPKSLCVGGIEYKVIEAQRVSDGRKALYGSIEYGACLIKISDIDCSAQEQKCVTMIHEALHGMIHHAALNLKKDSEERIITALAFGIYQLFQDNVTRLYDIVPQSRAESHE